MPYMEELLGDPVNLAVMMAALALVVALVAVLHYCVERKTMADRLRRLEVVLANVARDSGGSGQSSSMALAAEGRDDSGERPAEDASGGDPDSLPPGIRFV